MTTEETRSGAPRGMQAVVVLAALVAVLGTAPASGQTVSLPEPSVSLVTQSRQNEFSWQEVAPTDGRAVTDLGFFYTVPETTIVPNGGGGYDTLVVNTPASSPTGFPAPAPPIALVGSYSGNCDYFLRVTKDTRTGFDAPSAFPPRDVRVVLRYQLWLNAQSIGVPAFEDSVSYGQAGTQYFSPTGLGDIGLGITLNDNVVQPATGLGSIPVTISGLGTGLATQRQYLVTAPAGGGLPGSLTIRVLGPFQTTAQLPIGQFGRDTTIVVTAANTPVKVMDGMFVSLGPGNAAPTDTCIWSSKGLFPTSSKIEANLEAFGGYHVWRADLPDVDKGFTLLGEISLCDETKEFALQSSEQDLEAAHVELVYDTASRTYRVVDHDVHDDFPYRYALSTFDRGFLGNNLGITYEGNLVETGKIYPAPQVRDVTTHVYTVPNPYKRTAAWNEGRNGKIVFANLPPVCTIRIFNVATDHVKTIQHGPGQPRSTSPTSTSWDLVSDAGEQVVPGIYIYYVEAPGGFHQTGKIIIAR